MFVHYPHPHPIHMLKPYPKEWGLKSLGLGGVTRVGSPHDGISPLMKRHRRAHSSLSEWTEKRVWERTARRRLPNQEQGLRKPTLPKSPVFTTVRNQCLLFKSPIYDILLCRPSRLRHLTCGWSKLAQIGNTNYFKTPCPQNATASN